MRNAAPLLLLALLLAACAAPAMPTQAPAPAAAAATQQPTPTPILITQAPAPIPAKPTPEPGLAYVTLRIGTGEDGTADTPVFELYDNTGGMSEGRVLFSTQLDRKGGFKPYSKAVFNFTVPYAACQFVGWRLSKPAASGTDDAWLVQRISVDLNGENVYFDEAFADQGPMTAGGPLRVRWGNWSGTAPYKKLCRGG